MGGPLCRCSDDTFATMAFDFDAAVSAPFRMQPGLRRLSATAQQLTPAVVPQRGAARHLREKLAVLWAYREQALLCHPGFDPAPALSVLAQHAAIEQPQAWQVVNGNWLAPWLGWAVDADGQVHQQHAGWPEIGALLHALPAPWRGTALMTLAFAEDFAIVDARSGVIPWLAVCLPSGWAPEEKLGRSFADVHGPVAENRMVVQASGHLMRLVTGAERCERFVWTLTGQPRLHAHPARLDPQRWPEDLTLRDVAAQTWWRTERQTFIPVPGAGQAVFTILVDVQPLSVAMHSPERAARVHDALASMSPAVLRYRGLQDVQPLLLQWLAQRAAARHEAL